MRCVKLKKNKIHYLRWQLSGAHTGLVLKKCGNAPKKLAIFNSTRNSFLHQFFMKYSLLLRYNGKHEKRVGMCSRSTTPLGGGCPRWQLSWVVIILDGNCPWWQLSQVVVFRWQLSGCTWQFIRWLSVRIPFVFIHRQIRDTYLAFRPWLHRLQLEQSFGLWSELLAQRFVHHLQKPDEK